MKHSYVFFISVLYCIGGAVNSDVHAVLEKSFLDHPFKTDLIVDTHDTYFTTLLHDQAAEPIDQGRSQLYSQDLGLSKNIFFHPYHPNEQTSARSGDVVVLRNTLSIFFPSGVVWDQVPQEIRTFTGPSASLRLVTQNLPWKSTVPLLVRPHYATLPGAPWKQARYNVTQHIDFMVHPLDGTNVTVGGRHTRTIHRAGISTHSGDGDLIVLSPATPVIMGLDSAHGNFFWSACREGARRWVTLHWVLNDDDQEILDQVSADSATLRDLRERLAHAGLPPIVQRILANLLA